MRWSRRVIAIRPGLELPVYRRFCPDDVTSREPRQSSSRYAVSRYATKTFQTYRDAASLLDSTRGTAGGDEPQLVEIVAHVRSVRVQKKRAFAVLGDGSTPRTLQALLEPQDALKLSTGAATKIRGLWQRCPPSKEQTHELAAQEVELVGPSDPETYPIQKQSLTPEFLRTLPHLRIRTPTNALLARLRSECEFHLTTYFRSQGYVRLHPPAITSSDCEGAGEVFLVRQREKKDRSAQGSEHPQAKQTLADGEYFKTPKYLTVSNQLHLEASVHEHQRVWSLAPTFRAERSDTPRHLSEFYMLEAELRCSSLDEVMDVVEDCLRSVTKGVLDSTLGKEMLRHWSGNAVNAGNAGNAENAESATKTKSNLLETRMEGLRKAYWPRITYDKAIQLLEVAAEEDSSVFRFWPKWQTGLHLEHEKFIAATVGKGSPVFVTNYPAHLKPFYMLPTMISLDKEHLPASKPSMTVQDQRWTRHSLRNDVDADPAVDRAWSTVACFDLLLPDLGELVGGSLREHRYSALEQTMRQQKMSGLDWYLELRKYGSVPHGGFGIGFDRLLMYLSGTESIRDVVQWPRYYGRCDA